MLGRRQGLLPLAATATSIMLQCVFDPRLGAGVIALMIPLDLVFFGAGLYVRRRAAMVTSLRASTASCASSGNRRPGSPSPLIGKSSPAG